MCPLRPPNSLNTSPPTRCDGLGREARDDVLSQRLQLLVLLAHTLLDLVAGAEGIEARGVLAHTLGDEEVVQLGLQLLHGEGSVAVAVAAV